MLNVTSLIVLKYVLLNKSFLQGETRDVFNEKPSAEEQMLHLAEKKMENQLATSAVIHTQVLDL